ncbi:MAG: 2-C-methyl-D-erythritol 2,4-cyclodiphosphate synthase [Ignavibacteria bacterium]|nr:MAG: 2-C-methyl-D-erythritol 2,4-cyclodiphosphate synthase [Ignavibacteria bacterium]
MSTAPFRIGYGYDIHRLAEGESLIIGGVSIPSNFGTVAHSDGDVLLHAISDALLGALALGDIGEHFPDTDPAWRGVSSLDLLARCHAMVRERGYEIANLDATLVLERPKVLPYRDAMRSTIAAALELDSGQVSLKATTGEAMGFVGRGEGVDAHAMVLLTKRS